MSHRQLDRILTALAVRGAFLEPLADGDSGEHEQRCYVVKRAGLTDGDSPLRSIAMRYVQMGVRGGYLSGDIGRRLILSDAGRQRVRRLRAQRGAAHDIQAAGRSDSPLAWLRQRSGKNGRSLISDVEFEAAERLRLDFLKATMGMRTTSDWSAGRETGPSGPRYENGFSEVLDLTIAARQRISRALETADPRVARLVVDVCCHGMGLAQVEKSHGLPQRSSKLVLAIGLRELARHYGLSNARVRAVFSPDDGELKLQSITL
ncbi:MAG: DUF6456 domain-containing protein [Pseudomonadota bacterium]